MAPRSEKASSRGARATNDLGSGGHYFNLFDDARARPRRVPAKRDRKLRRPQTRVRLRNLLQIRRNLSVVLRERARIPQRLVPGSPTAGNRRNFSCSSRPTAPAFAPRASPRSAPCRRSTNSELVSFASSATLAGAVRGERDDGRRERADRDPRGASRRARTSALDAAADAARRRRRRGIDARGARRANERGHRRANSGAREFRDGA